MNSTFTKILRIILGLGLLFFGLSKLINLHIMPTHIYTGDAAIFIDSLSSTGYILKVIGILEIFIGLLLLINKWVSFALLLLAPITVNILLFHLFLDTPGLLVALVITILNVILIYKHWKVYKPLFH
ncbi:DoxX family membrane protein [Aequorivita vladivostokensis]|jgi:putative oxidoreductase|uniref:DoxX protein n=1 Tax=Aequorivita vladivostokensis TaxID=171194 RepID=A0ABR5DIB6_9FLAO|nr:DoxX family membrane protein [Aequorivita vladivostokensis]MAB40564.1 DoxX family membrane protein [Aequorivita sp.]KJJ38521.1 DoxX protein [Aequorivita vladivostokensis]MAB56369.1 DoxX family membrane protein [Aequorivita sp.]MBF29913.1 DoxX family membrane protein [Aequorivita sp.]MDX1782640.1 DoxX family membrane protein [Aequorivita vladivostokensis]|tara:strand:- start:101799 stop:102179 length:381 start_codon:yes stop_codon:yes gene_type:complete